MLSKLTPSSPASAYKGYWVADPRPSILINQPKGVHYGRVEKTSCEDSRIGYVCGLCGVWHYNFPAAMIVLPTNVKEKV